MHRDGPGCYLYAYLSFECYYCHWFDSLTRFSLKYNLSMTQKAKSCLNIESQSIQRRQIWNDIDTILIHFLRCWRCVWVNKLFDLDGNVYFIMCEHVFVCCRRDVHVFVTDNGGGAGDWRGMTEISSRVWNL